MVQNVFYKFPVLSDLKLQAAELGWENLKLCLLTVYNTTWLIASNWQINPSPATDQWSSPFTFWVRCQKSILLLNLCLSRISNGGTCWSARPYETHTPDKQQTGLTICTFRVKDLSLVPKSIFPQLKLSFSWIIYLLASVFMHCIMYNTWRLPTNHRSFLHQLRMDGSFVHDFSSPHRIHCSSYELCYAEVKWWIWL